ncbi:DNA-methyltransferase [Mariniblastus fucicola]|uniref:Methyltransferase n=1 Tax=Mariniblastus fucicola TaxID=980251 RepID=A0A5B9PE05_9BACT|nr:site-specific DNA-methyltransferase [Mariniblastus fucicola]QEG21261.1 Modification methylase DpnIIB [Mariniblastus fucicola]
MPAKMKSLKKCLDQFLCGDAIEVAKTLPDACVDTIVTSPPYWQQRDYGTADQIGQEISPAAYVERLSELFDELKRVVKPTGSVWMVIGDKYLKGELMGMPWRVAFGLKDVGWRMRSDCIWQKPNAMPSSTRTRPTTDHEYIFLFSNGKDYFYDADAIREPHVTFSESSKMKGGRKHFGKRGGTPEKGKNTGDTNLHDGRWDQAFHPKGRNKRTVWSIPLSKFREAHFAVYPPKLVETCIAATCPPGGVVLDPFSGAGTTAVVAHKLGRKFIAIDCNEEYCEMARRRLGDA